MGLVFQRYFHSVFRVLISEKLLIVYVDDFIMLVENEAERLQKLQHVLNAASEYSLE